MPQVAAILKEEAAGGRTRKISESQGVARALKSTKTQSMQVELTEPLFTYMRNTAGIKDTIQTMGFGRKDMFSRGITKNQTQEWLKISAIFELHNEGHDRIYSFKHLC